MKIKLYQKIAHALKNYNCNVQQWIDNADNDLNEIDRELLPSGSGFDSGSKIVREEYKNRIKIETAFHHMNDTGYYTQWTEHIVTITPCLDSSCFDVKVSGRNVNDIKEYIAENFINALNQEVEL